MIFIGLLTHAQKQAGYFVSQDEDFVYLFHGRDSKPRLISIVLYETCTIKQLRDAAVVDSQKSAVIVDTKVEELERWQICKA